MNKIPVIKDSQNELAIPSAWRPVLVKIVDALVEMDYRFHRTIDGLMPVSEQTTQHIQRYIKDYGETLVPLPEESWQTSIYIWMGTFWEVYVDLWTLKEGRSDLVVSVRVFETSNVYNFEIHMVYVP